MLAIKYMLFSTNFALLLAFECIHLPPPPVNGRLIGPKGFLRARLVCPAGQDVPLNTRSGGSLECDPRAKPYDLIDVPRHECLPLKKPNSLNMDMELIYYSSRSCLASETFLKDTIQSKLPSVAPDNLPSELRAETSKGLELKWLSTGVSCGKTRHRGKPMTEIIVKPTLRMTPKDMNKDPMTYVKLMNVIRAKLFNRSDFHINTTPQQRWTVAGYELEWTFYSALYSFCGNHQHTLGAILHESKILSCRGCSRDYYLPANSRHCRSCKDGTYTLQAFSDRCIACPAKSKWTESDELYDRFCVRYQADYD